MEVEKEIKIVADDGNFIDFQLIENDRVSREQVESIKAAIAMHEQEIANYQQKIAEESNQIEELKEKLAFAEKVIAMADEKKAAEMAEQEAAVQENAEVVA